MTEFLRANPQCALVYKEALEERRAERGRGDKGGVCVILPMLGPSTVPRLSSPAFGLHLLFFFLFPPYTPICLL